MCVRVLSACCGLRIIVCGSPHALACSHSLSPVSRRFYAKAVNCCADVRLLLDSGPDGGSCPPVGDCRGFNGTCGELPGQFADVAVMPDYPNGLKDYTCTAFPDDDRSVDSFIVGLISLAIAIPVTVFIQTCFSSAWHARRALCGCALTPFFAVRSRKRQRGAGELAGVDRLAQAHLRLQRRVPRVLCARASQLASDVRTTADRYSAPPLALHAWRAPHPLHPVVRALARRAGVRDGGEPVAQLCCVGHRHRDALGGGGA
jgi:hypothetical protein